MIKLNIQIAYLIGDMQAALYQLYFLNLCWKPRKFFLQFRLKKY